MKAVVFIVLLLLPFYLWADSSMSLNRNPVQVNETFTLDIRSDNTDATAPQLKLPAGIEQLQRNNINSRSIVNGKITAEQRWVYKLVARKPGDYHFDSVKIGKENTNALTLTVNEKADATGTSRAAKLMLRADVDQKVVYTQQQLILSIKLFRAVPVRFAQITEPQPADALVQQMGDDVEYETEENGQNYFVLERRYAIFPQKAGELQIAPVQFNGDITVSSSNGLFGAIAESEPVSLQTGAITVTVNPALTATQWLPARAIELSAQVLPSGKKIQEGEPLTVNLTLRVNGQIAANVPAIPFNEQNGWHYYPDQANDVIASTSDGIQLERRQKIAVVPTQVGRVQLPRIELPWFNTSTGQAEIAYVDFEAIEVLANTTATPAPVLTSPVTETPAEKSAPVVTITDSTTPNYWIWLSATLALLWIFTCVLWWLKHRAHHRVAPTTVSDVEVDSKSLLDACTQHDARGAQQALLRWARQQLAEPNLSWAQLIQRSGPIAEQLHALDAALYSPSAPSWNGEELAKKIPLLQNFWKPHTRENHQVSLNP